MLFADSVGTPPGWRETSRVWRAVCVGSHTFASRKPGPIDACLPSEASMGSGCGPARSEPPGFTPNRPGVPTPHVERLEPRLHPTPWPPAPCRLRGAGDKADSPRARLLLLGQIG